MVIIMILSPFETEPNEDVFGKWVEDQEKSNENSDDKTIAKLLCVL